MGNLKSNYRGFSLVEMAVVITLIGVLMTFGIKLASSFQDRAAFTATHNKQMLIKEALTSYLAQNGRLPCPASLVSPPTGLESPTPPTGACDVLPGFIPYDTLGMSRDSAVDGWGRLFTYEVTNTSIPTCPATWVSVANFPIAASPIKTYHDGEAGCITIVDGTTTPSINRTVVAAIVSNGPNGEGGYSSKGVITVLSEADTTATKEQDNIPSHSGKIKHTFHTEPVTLTKFDDVVLEISANDLLAPLKRDGSIVSINQVARDYFAKNITVVNAPNPCTISYPTGMVTPLPVAGVTNQPTVTFSVTYNAATFTQSMLGSNYGCPSGFNY